MLKYNGFATVRKTTKLIEGGKRGLQTIGIYVIASTFFTFFQNPKSRDFLRFLPCFVRFLELCCPSLAAAVIDSVDHSACCLLHERVHSQPLKKRKQIGLPR